MLSRSNISHEGVLIFQQIWKELAVLNPCLCVQSRHYLLKVEWLSICIMAFLWFPLLSQLIALEYPTSVI